MATPLTVAQDLPAAPAAVYALLTDRGFLQSRLEATGGIDPEVVGIDTSGEGVRVTTRQAIPNSVLPPMVASMMSGNPVTERVETWSPSGDGYCAEFALTIKGAPASLKGTMTLAVADGGSRLTIDGSANVPIPMFGGKIEQVIVEQLGEIFTGEGEYTRGALSA